MAQRTNPADYHAEKAWIRSGDEIARNIPTASIPVAVKILLHNVDVVYCQNREILQLLNELKDRGAPSQSPETSSQQRQAGEGEALLSSLPEPAIRPLDAHQTALSGAQASAYPVLHNAKAHISTIGDSVRTSVTQIASGNDTASQARQQSSIGDKAPHLSSHVNTSVGEVALKIQELDQGSKDPLQKVASQRGLTGIVEPMDLRTGGSWKTLKSPCVPEDPSIPLNTYLNSHVPVTDKLEEACLSKADGNNDSDDLIRRFAKDPPPKQASIQDSMQPDLFQVNQPATSSPNSKAKPLRPDQIRDQLRGLTSSPSRNLEDLMGLVIESPPPSIDKPSLSTSPRWVQKTSKHAYTSKEDLWDRVGKMGADDTTAEHPSDHHDSSSSSKLYEQLTPPSEEIATALPTNQDHNYVVSNNTKGSPNENKEVKCELETLHVGDYPQATPQPKTDLNISKWTNTAESDQKELVPSTESKDIKKPLTESAALWQEQSEHVDSIGVDSSKSAACYSTEEKKSGEKFDEKPDKQLDEVVAKEVIISGLHSQISQIRTCAPFVNDADTAEFWAPALFSSHLNSVQESLSMLVDALLREKIRPENMKELLNLVTNLQEGDFPAAYHTVQKRLYVRMKEDGLNILPWMMQFVGMAEVISQKRFRTIYDTDIKLSSAPPTLTAATPNRRRKKKPKPAEEGYQFW